MSAPESAIVVISSSYPYGKGEVYLERELKYFKQSFDKVKLFPQVNQGTLRDIQEGIEVFSSLQDRPKKVKSKFLFKYFTTIFWVFWNEIFRGKGGFYFIRTLRQRLAEILIACELAEKFEEEVLKSLNVETAFYAVWMDSSALMLSLLVRWNKISDYVVRLHGYDLYDERRPGNYMPFRYFCFRQAKKIFIVSKAGKTYLEEKGLFVDKLITNYSGIYDFGLNPERKEQEFTLVSCSNLIPLKRVDGIIESLKNIDFPINWIHIGDGELRNELEEKAKKLPSNVNCDFKGQLSFDQVVQFYASYHIDLFIHLSESEGLPLSLVEAMSFGIPVVATNAGGTNEIINEHNGNLLPLEIDTKKIADIITVYFKDQELANSKRLAAREYFLKHFLADKNYPAFIEEIKT